jgi:hypothetical protein
VIFDSNLTLAPASSSRNQASMLSWAAGAPPLAPPGSSGDEPKTSPRYSYYQKLKVAGFTKRSELRSGGDVADCPRGRLRLRFPPCEERIGHVEFTYTLTAYYVAYCYSATEVLRRYVSPLFTKDRSLNTGTVSSSEVTSPSFEAHVVTHVK